MTQVVATKIPILLYSQETAARHVAERARLAASGRTSPYADSIIAAIARTNNLVLVTLNRADFQHFQRLTSAD